LTTIDTLEEAEAPFVGSQVADAPGPRRLHFGDLWWRYLVSLIAILFAIFPALYVLSAALNPVPSLSSASLIPSSLTLDNFREILTNPTVNGEKTNTQFPHWYLNSMIVAFAAAFCTVVLGALAAYAFSRFRFKGRRMGMLTLLLIQMFPQFLAVVAIYLILLRVGAIFPVLGLNSLSGLIIVYLGGALGVNAWLMKGFFDSIPNELDESARVDGATPAQVFWGIILPLGAPVLAVVGLLSFISTMNEYLLASRILQTTDKFTLPVGMYGFISQQYGERWGPFCAGVVLAAIPVVILFLFLQRFIVHGLTSGSVKG
jgi:arabinogalactan oligomer / maltooligosaccharide transport system permease protein